MLTDNLGEVYLFIFTIQNSFMSHCFAFQTHRVWARMSRDTCVPEQQQSQSRGRQTWLIVPNVSGLDVALSELVSTQDR